MRLALFTKSFLLCLLASFTINEFSAQQTFSFIEMGMMPDPVVESSGLAVATENSFWTHNDRGGKPEIYEVDLNGELVRTVQVLNAENVDWEDMTQDNSGNLYIGDFGNNKKDRVKFVIYKIATSKVKVFKDGADSPVTFSVIPEIIEFVLPYEAMTSDCHYDVEAMIWNEGRLTMFTKDRCDKVNNQMFIYSVPDIGGKYTAEGDEPFNWDDREKTIKITSADVSWDGRSLVLLSKDAIHLFFGYRKNKYFSGSYRYIPMEKTKKEAVCHLGDCDLYITEENKKDVPGRLLKINLCNINMD